MTRQRTWTFREHTHRVWDSLETIPAESLRRRNYPLEKSTDRGAIREYYLSRLDSPRQQHQRTVLG
jgi:hypothetical protein